MNKEQKNEALEKAWLKICEYVKENFTNVFPEGTKFRWFHNPYYWIEFVVTPDGDARIYRGMHSTGCPDEVITPHGAYNTNANCCAYTIQSFIATHPSTRPMGRDRKCLNIEKVVSGWRIIRRNLELMKEQEESIELFEVDDNCKVDYSDKVYKIKKEVMEKIYNLLPESGTIDMPSDNDGVDDIFVLWSDISGNWSETKILSLERCEGKTKNFRIIVEDSFGNGTVKLSSCDCDFCFNHIDWMIEIYNVLYSIRNSSVKS